MSVLDKMARAALKLQAAAAILPAVAKVAKVLEVEVPWSKLGKEKVEAIRQAAEKAADLQDDAVDFLKDIWPVVTALLAGLIEIWNLVGKFKKGVPAPTVDADG